MYAVLEGRAGAWVWPMFAAPNTGGLNPEPQLRRRAVHIALFAAVAYDMIAFFSGRGGEGGERPLGGG